MRRLRLLLVLFVISIPCQSVTIVKNVGHGDCYVVISDGRIIVIDAGPMTSTEGLVSLLRQEYFHYDRIVITHVHSDHAGGLIPAGQYARQTGSQLSTDMLVSNHGEHDLGLVVHEARLKTLLSSLREVPIVGMDDPALAKLSFADENISIEGIALGKGRRPRNENLSSLVLKVTEIRDGERRAVLFLGDIEKSQQAELLSRADAKEVFRDVRAITLPHHGRQTTLARNFLKEAREFTGEGLVLLHSDRLPLDDHFRRKAEGLGMTVKSTVDAAGQDVYLDLFGQGKTFHVVKDSMTNLADIVASEESRLLMESGFTMDEVVEAVGRFSNRSPAKPLPANTVISWPTTAWIGKEVEQRRAEFAREVDRLIGQLRSRDAIESADAERTLTERRSKMNSEQAGRFDSTLQEVTERRAQERFNEETERLLVQLESKDVAESLKAENELEARRPKLSREQTGRLDAFLQDFSRDTESLIRQLQSFDITEATRAEEALALRRGRLNQEQLDLITRLSQETAARYQLEKEITQGLQNGWRVESNPNIDDSKIFLYRRGSLRYVIREIDYETWEVHQPGRGGRFGLATYGRTVGRIGRPAEVEVTERYLCEYCGKEAVGYCHIRNKYVCDEDRYFTKDGVYWRCP
jgi:ribosomal protein L37AE/L43A